MNGLDLETMELKRITTEIIYRGEDEIKKEFPLKSRKFKPRRHTKYFEWQNIRKYV